jgi:hypothetical protein
MTVSLFLSLPGEDPAIHLAGFRRPKRHDFGRWYYPGGTDSGGERRDLSAHGAAAPRRRRRLRGTL